MLLCDHQAGQFSPICPRTITGEELIEWIMTLPEFPTEQSAEVLGQRLLDAAILHCIDPDTNQRVISRFIDHRQSLFRLASDSTIRFDGKQSKRRSSIALGYLTKLNGFQSSVQVVGEVKMIPAIAVLQKDIKKLLLFESATTDTPYDELPLTDAVYFTSDRIHQTSIDQPSTYGYFLILLSASRSLCLSFDTSIQVDSWKKELQQLNCSEIEKPNETITTETIQQAAKLVRSSRSSIIALSPATTKKQRLAAEAKNKLKIMRVRLGFSFDAVNENNNVSYIQRLSNSVLLFLVIFLFPLICFCCLFSVFSLMMVY